GGRESSGLFLCAVAARICTKQPMHAKRTRLLFPGAICSDEHIEIVFHSLGICMINVSKRRTLRTAVAASVALAFASAAHAAEDQSLTWNAITLYGVYDIGVGYQSHGAPLSQD